MRRGAKFLSLTLLLWLAASAIAAEPEGAFGAERFVLKNGLEVVVIPNHRAPLVTHMVWYRVGSADEVAGRSGLAHFLEHLMFKGTRRVPPSEFSKIVARNGGRDNAFTSSDYTAYYQDIARDRLELVMSLEADRMMNLTLDEEIVRTERDVILEERRSRIDNDPASRLREQMLAALYVNHPYGRPVIGWAEEIAGLTRDKALDFYRGHYAPNNAVLVVAGDVTAEEVRPLAEKYFGRVPKRNIAPRRRPSEPPPVAARRVILASAEVQQPRFSRVYLAPSYATAEGREAHAIDLLAQILGGGMTSRLYRALAIEKGLAANVGAYYAGDGLDGGTFWVSASPRPGVEIAALEQAIDEVIALVTAEGVTDEELTRAAGRLKAEAVYARDSLDVMARVFGTALTTGETVEDVEAWPWRIAETTRSEVNRAAASVLVPEASVTGLLLPVQGAEDAP